MIRCSACGSLRVVSRITLVNPRTGRAQFRLTDLSLPILVIFLAAILYAAVDSLLSPGSVHLTFGLVFLLIFLVTVLSLLIAYVQRGRFIERLRYRCTECQHHWDVAVPPARHGKPTSEEPHA